MTSSLWAVTDTRFLIRSRLGSRIWLLYRIALFPKMKRPVPAHKCEKVRDVWAWWSRRSLALERELLGNVSGIEDRYRSAVIAAETTIAWIEDEPGDEVNLFDIEELGIEPSRPVHLFGTELALGSYADAVALVLDLFVPWTGSRQICRSRAFEPKGNPSNFAIYPDIVTLVALASIPDLALDYDRVV